MNKVYKYIFAINSTNIITQDYNFFLLKLLLFKYKREKNDI